MYVAHPRGRGMTPERRPSTLDESAEGVTLLVARKRELSFPTWPSAQTSQASAQNLQDQSFILISPGLGIPA